MGSWARCMSLVHACLCMYMRVCVCRQMRLCEQDVGVYVSVYYACIYVFVGAFLRVKVCACARSVYTLDT